ncbi:unnamed protein product [Ectocarpus sp. 4 AP-2014]
MTPLRLKSKRNNKPLYGGTLSKERQAADDHNSKSKSYTARSRERMEFRVPCLFPVPCPPKIRPQLQKSNHVRSQGRAFPTFTHPRHFDIPPSLSHLLFLMLSASLLYVRLVRLGF